MVNNDRYNLDRDKLSRPGGPDKIFNEDVQRREGLDLHSTEAVEFTEGLEFGGEGPRVSESSERTGEEKAAGLGQKGGQPAKALTQEEIKAKLLASCPAERVMKKQVTNIVNKEIHQLTKEFKKARRDVSAAYQLAQIVARIRQLKEVLSQLAYATYEMLRSLWLKIVHNIA